MPLASFLDNGSVAWAIVGGYVVLAFVVWAVQRLRPERSPRAYGCITGLGLFFLLGAMTLADWLIDHVF